jgi:hypothetical protein
MAMMLIALAMATAQATFDMDVDQFKSSISVAPPVASVGIARTITLVGVWPNACPPNFNGASMEHGKNSTTLILRFNVPATLAACAQIDTPFSAQTSFTPSRAGDFNVVAITNDARMLARAKMLTLSTDTP